ncbi:MAG: AEC family transporter [Halanaerobiales bacterium]|nr:AEC family transporter [Halanaerobiales bacterium]
MSASYVEIFPKVVPIFVLLILGYLIKKNRFLTSDTINEIKKLIVNFSLPAVLFTSFLKLNIQLNFIWIVLIVFLINIIMLYLAKLFISFSNKDDPYLPLVFTGFEVGMLGIPLFGTIYGLDNVKFMGVVDIGHEFYIWFVLLAMLLKLNKDNQNSGFKNLFKSFISSPVIISIISALFINITGIVTLFEGTIAYNSVINSLDLIASLTIPLILIVIGYEIDFKLEDISLSVKIIFVRLLFFITFGLLIEKYIFTDILSLSEMYSRALMSLLILPPPFILPLFINEKDLKERLYINSTLSLHTLVSIGLFVLISFIY